MWQVDEMAETTATLVGTLFLECFHPCLTSHYPTSGWLSISTYHPHFLGAKKREGQRGKSMLLAQSRTARALLEAPPSSFPSILLTRRDAWFLICGGAWAFKYVALQPRSGRIERRTSVGRELIISSILWEINLSSILFPHCLGDYIKD